MHRSLCLRFGLGLALIAAIPAISVDDYFRVYHAMFWWTRPRFANSIHWLPLYAWIDGTLIGLLGESRWVPRLVSLVVGIAGCYAAVVDATDPSERKFRFELSMWLPSSIVLFAVPLTEAMFGALIAVHTSRLARYRDSRSGLDAVVSSAALLLATSLRYEAWVLIPLSAVLIAWRPSIGLARAVPIALLPCAFPLVWFDHVRTRTGDASSFLDAISGDQFGAGSVADLLGGSSIGFAVVFVLALTVAASTVLDASAPPRIRLISSYACAFGGMILALVALGQVPSQYPARLVHVPTLLAVPAMVRWIGRLQVKPLLANALFAVIGLTTAFRVDSVRATDDIVAATALRAALARDHEASAVVEGEFPEVTQFVADSNAPGRVVVEGSGGRCSVSIGSCAFPCGRPRWVDRLRFALVTNRAFEDRLRVEGFVVVRRIGRRALLDRVDRARRVCEVRP